MRNDNPDASDPVICETRSRQKVEISWTLVDDSSSQRFFDAVSAVWGEEYAPKTDASRRFLSLQ
jgi:hypothetical protein